MPGGLKKLVSVSVFIQNTCNKLTVHKMSTVGQWMSVIHIAVHIVDQLIQNVIKFEVQT